MINIFIPSYHRPDNVKTAKYFVGLGYDPKKIHVFIDSETDDIEEYAIEMNKLGVQLHVFDMGEARYRYDYIHRASLSRRSAGQARNMFQDFAKNNGIDFYCVIDDDTEYYEVYTLNTKRKYIKNFEILNNGFELIREFMKKYKIGLFGCSQSGDLIGGIDNKLIRKKVMNTSFYLMPFIERGERGQQDDDTSLFVGIMNEGLFCGSLACGLILHQNQSATQKGGLTDLYNECKLVNKALTTVIQFPSAIYAEYQTMNGNRLHHHICSKNLFPCLIKNIGGRNNIEWNTYSEDIPFTNSPKRNYKLD